MTATAPFIDIMRTVFPVVALDPREAGEMAWPDFFGTAFAVAPRVFMTAAHVVRAAEPHGQLALAGPASSGEPQPMGAARITRSEIWDERDIALLFCNVSDVTYLNTWVTHRVQVLTDVSSFGHSRKARDPTDLLTAKIGFQGTARSAARGRAIGHS